MPRLQSQAASSRNRNAVKDSSLCQFPFNDGRRCRMLRHPGHPSLCIFHARAELQLLESERLGTELAQTLTGDYMTATDVNHILDRKSTRLNSSHLVISYAVFCLKKQHHASYPSCEQLRRD